MNKIVKIVYQDGTELEPENLAPLEIRKNIMLQYHETNKYLQQFYRFERAILEVLEDETVKEYAIDNCGVVDEDEIEKTEEKNIGDFSDEEVFSEAKERNLLGGTSIISESFLLRFARIIERENELEIDILLGCLEEKLKIV